MVTVCRSQSAVPLPVVCPLAMLGLILPGLVVIGAAASPAVAAAMANVFPNRLGNWVEDNVIPNARYPSMERVEEEEEEEQNEQELAAQPEQLEHQARWERMTHDEDVSLSRRRDVADELAARDAGPRRVISAPYGHERGSMPAEYAEMLYQGGGRLSAPTEMPHLYENARRYERAADAEAMNKIRVSLNSPDTTEKHRVSMEARMMQVSHHEGGGYGDYREGMTTLKV